MKNRIVQLDFLKCVFILHVIMIHLVYLGQTYPWLKEFFLLYTTPVFFVISGFLAHVDKPFTEFCQKVKWWLVPLHHPGFDTAHQ
jgi:fucose 4-O-acetylase-like acetyltransferase